MGRQLSQKQIRAISNVITDMGYAVSLKQVKTNSLQHASVGEELYSKHSGSLFCLTTELSYYPSKAGRLMRKRNIPFPSICAGEQKSPRVFFFLEAQSVLPETVIESQGSCFLFSRAAQGSGSAERKSIHQRVITGLISLLL